jgi:hypothetical protein
MNILWPVIKVASLAWLGYMFFGYVLPMDISRLSFGLACAGLVFWLAAFLRTDQ